MTGLMVQGCSSSAGMSPAPFQDPPAMRHQLPIPSDVLSMSMWPELGIAIWLMG